MGKPLKFIGSSSPLKHLLRLWKNWELVFLTLGCGKFKLQEDEKEGNDKRKENHDLVMANLNYWYFSI